MMKPTKPKEFYIHTKAEGYLLVKGRPVKIEGCESLDLFISRVYLRTYDTQGNPLSPLSPSRYWTVTEGRTGMRVCSMCDTQKEARAETQYRLKENAEKVKRCIQEHIGKYGLSPRYQE